MVSLSASLESADGAVPLQHALAGAHPVDRLRRLLPVSGSEDWRWLHQSCGVPPVYLESLHSVLQALPVEIEGSLWEAARDDESLSEFCGWLARFASWNSRDDAAREILAAVEEDPAFLQSPAFAMLDLLGYPGAANLSSHTSLLPALRPLTHDYTHRTVLLRLHSLARRCQARLRGLRDFIPWQQQAQRIAELAPEALARQLTLDFAHTALPGGWLMDATAGSSLTETRIQSVLDFAARGTLALTAGDPWSFHGPAALLLQARRSVNVRLPWLRVVESGLLSRRCRHTPVALDGPGQIRVLSPDEDSSARWGQFSAEVLSGTFSFRDGLARGGPDRLHWSRTFPLQPGPLPRFLGRLLEDYRFPELPLITDPADLTFDFSVRRDWVEGFALAPHSKDPRYATIVTRIARTLQWAMRRWVPFLFFLEHSAEYSSRSVMPILIYAASTPRAVKKRREFGYEVLNKTLVAQAIRSAAPRLHKVYREFDPERRTFDDSYRSVIRATSVEAALNYVWRFPRQFERLIQFDFFLIEQSVHFLESARRLRNSLEAPTSSLSRLFQTEVDGLARSLRRQLKRSLPTDLEACVPLLFIQAISALHGEGLGADIPAATVTLRQGTWECGFANSPSVIDDELSFDGLSIPSVCA
jgi:hypothetical protein